MNFKNFLAAMAVLTTMAAAVPATAQEGGGAEAAAVIETVTNNIVPSKTTIAAFDEVGDSVSTVAIFAAGTGPDLTAVMANCPAPCRVEFAIMEGQLVLRALSSWVGDENLFSIPGAYLNNQFMLQANTSTKFYELVLTKLTEQPDLLVGGTLAPKIALPEQLDTVTAELESLAAELSLLQMTLATVTAERDALPTADEHAALMRNANFARERFMAICDAPGHHHGAPQSCPTEGQDWPSFWLVWDQTTVMVQPGDNLVVQP